MKSGSPQFRLLTPGGRGGYPGYLSRPLFLLFCGVTVVWLYCFAASGWHTGRQNSDQLKGQILELSEKYVRSLAKESGDLVDGPYTGRLTGYDLKKTLAVLLQDLMERLARLEKRVVGGSGGNASSGGGNATRESGGVMELFKAQPAATPPRPPAAPAAAAGPVIAVDALMLLNGYQESCDFPLESKFEFPECEEKVEWMLKHWRDDPCYAQHGVDGTECSMKIFLSEVEEFCPVLPFRQRLLRVNNSFAWVTRQQLLGDAEGRERARLKLLDQLAPAPELRARVAEQWAPLAEAADSAAAGWPDRWPRQRILVHAGGTSETQRLDAPPPMEASQLADLLAAAAVLGHQLTVTMDKAGLRAALGRLNYMKTECMGKRDAVVTHLVTDMIGIMQVRAILGKSFPRFSCLYRVLAPFGVEPKFNDRAYSSANDLASSVTGLDLMPSQYLSLFPFTLENTFLGAGLTVASGRPPLSEEAKPPPLTVEAFVFGFGDPVWKDSAFYLNLLKPHFSRMHTAVDPSSHPSVPQYIVNHGRLNYTRYRHLLTSIGGLFVGLGSPFEHLAPLEAVSLGLPFLNLRFSPPLDRSNSPYLREVPVSRKFHSQDPYLESVGEPSSYLVDLEAKQAIPAIVAKASATATAVRRGSLNLTSLVPREFSPLAFVSRVRALFSGPSLCRETPLDPVSWPVNQTALSALSTSFAASSSIAGEAATAVQFFLGVEGRSCSETCSADGRRAVCAPDQMRVINRRMELQERGIRCRRVRYDNSLAFPALSGTGQCHFLSNARLFSCDERQAGYSRLCPCRNLVPAAPGGAPPLKR